MKKIIINFYCFFKFCATPTVVNVIGPNDNKLTCEELSAEIAANEYADELRG